MSHTVAHSSRAQHSIEYEYAARERTADEENKKVKMMRKEKRKMERV